MVRRAAVAGQFYPGTKEELRKKIEQCFKHELGPGSLPGKEGSAREIKGLVAPHAGYTYSGPVAAHAYKALYQDGMPDTFIVIGPNHHGMGASIALGSEAFETPLGTVEIHTDTVEKLKNGDVRIDNNAHVYEHSIEVQLPFLQYLYGDVRVVPICLTKQDYETAVKLGKLLKEVIADTDAVIIASTDFSHYVLKGVAEERDRMAIDKIIANDPESFYRTVMKEHISMCGYGPVVAAMVATGFTSARLLKYATSGDVMPMRDVVGYASMVLR